MAANWKTCQKTEKKAYAGLLSVGVQPMLMHLEAFAKKIKK